MQKTLTSTQINTNQQIFSVREVDLLAMEMRSNGCDLKTVSGLIGKKHGTVRAWFMEGGRLHKTYQKYLREQTQARLEQARRGYQGCLNKAVGVLMALLEDEQPRIRYLAATKIIDWNLGVQNTEVEEKDDPVQRILEARGILPLEKDALNG